jgi:hypothetical protein
MEDETNDETKKMRTSGSPKREAGMKDSRGYLTSAAAETMSRWL